MTPLPSALLRAYRETTYRVEVLGHPIDLRIDAASEELDALLRKHGVVSAAYITAENPQSRADFTDDENAAAQARLCDALQRDGRRFIRGTGIPATADWRPEHSFLVLGITHSDAVDLGARFDQRAILFCEIGQPVALVVIGAVAKS